MEFPCTDIFILIFILLCCFILYYCLVEVQRPLILCKSEIFLKFIRDNIPSTKEYFWPTIWCFDPIAQTVLPYLFHKKSNVKWKKQIINLEDGGQLALNWLNPEKWDEYTPTILILPGLTGSTGTPYVDKLSLKTIECGFRCINFNYRGKFGVKLKTPRTSCASKTANDLKQAVDQIYDIIGENSPLGVIGISLGALILGNYLSSSHGMTQTKIKAGLLLSVPYDPFKATESMETGLYYIMNMSLAQRLVQNFKKNQDFLETVEDKKWNIDRVKKSHLVSQFDEEFTSKVFGYSDLNEYYEDARLTPNKLNRIKIPVLSLSAVDDPFQPLVWRSCPKLFKYQNVAVVVTHRGGHVGFMDGFLPVNDQDVFYLRIYAEYFKSIFKNKKFETLILTLHDNGEDNNNEEELPLI